ncbi:MAG TPA: beta-N-acetylglucosaminidase domain-containing protein, partial [bacterium]|nr:beta-N-acetylglucosaminidase domain-containing protein [bacterium]
DTEFYLIRPNEAGENLQEFFTPFLGAETWGQIPEEGFLIVSGLQDYENFVFLVSKSERGFRYASQAVVDLMLRLGDRFHLPRGFVLDYPDFGKRGVIEAFSGPQWSESSRLDVIRFMARMRMNTYIYAPAGDEHINAKWFEPYPEEHRKRLGTLVNVAEENRVEFVFGVRPGPMIRYARVEDCNLLCDKYRTAVEMGVTHFALIFDQTVQELGHAEDKNTYRSLAEAHADLANKVLAFLRQQFQGAELIVCPASANQSAPSPYHIVLGSNLDPAISLFWMGGVDPTGTWDNYQIRASDAKRMKSAVNRPLFVWDNFPSNELARNRLHMGPVSGRSPELSTEVLGFVANPMNEAMASTVPLATIADFLWNSFDYSSEVSFRRACNWVGGSLAGEDLHFFALQCQNSFLWNPASSEVSHQKEVLKMLQAVGQDALFDPTPLSDLWRQYQMVGDNLSWKLQDKGLYKEIEPYLQLLRLYGETGPVCIKLLQLASSRESASANRELWENFLLLSEKRNNSARFGRTIGGSSMSALIQEAFLSGIRALGAELPKVQANLEAYIDFTIDRALDNDRQTFFWSNRTLRDGDYVTLELPRASVVEKVEILQGEPSRPDDFVQQGVLEGSLDGLKWLQLASLAQPEETVRLEAKALSFLRIRCTADQDKRLLLREFRVYSGSPIEIAMKPTKLLAGSLASLVNGNLLDSCSLLSGLEKGTSLEIDLVQTKEISSILVYQDREKYYVGFRIESSADGQNWSSHSTD